jgi:type II secretory pathway pseudopilin PulG
MRAVIVASQATDWISALSEAASALVAIVVLVIAAVTLGPQLADLRSQRAERETRQARQISAWAEARRDDAAGRVLVVRNMSNQPIHRCLLWLINDSTSRENAAGPLFGKKPSAWTSIVTPHDDYSYELSTTRGRPRRRPDVEIVFQDEEGRSWWRDRDGVLARVPPAQVPAYEEQFRHVSGAER